MLVGLVVFMSAARAHALYLHWNFLEDVYVLMTFNMFLMKVKGTLMRNSVFDNDFCNF